MDNEERSEAEVIRDVASSLVAAAGWMKAFAVILVITGVVQCLTLVGVLVGWFPILAGVILFQSASLVEEARLRSSEDKLKRSFQKLKTFFMLIVIVPIFMMGVLLVVLLIRPSNKKPPRQINVEMRLPNGAVVHK